MFSDNIFLDQNGKYVLGDFGHAVNFDGPNYKVVNEGDKNYSAPEFTSKGFCYIDFKHFLASWDTQIWSVFLFSFFLFFLLVEVGISIFSFASGFLTSSSLSSFALKT